MVAVVLFETDDITLALETAEGRPDAEGLGNAVFRVEREGRGCHAEEVAFSIDINEPHLILHGPVRVEGRGGLRLYQFVH